MDKVKIKRVARNKKKVTTAQKALAGIGVGAGLLGGAGSMTQKTNQTQIVGAQSQKQTKANSDVKSKIANVFKSAYDKTIGVSQAKADAEEEDGAGFEDFGGWQTGGCDPNVYSGGWSSNGGGGGGYIPEAPDLTQYYTPVVPTVSGYDPSVLNVTLPSSITNSSVVDPSANQYIDSSTEQIFQKALEEGINVAGVANASNNTVATAQVNTEENISNPEVMLNENPDGTNKESSTAVQAQENENPDGTLANPLGDMPEDYQGISKSDLAQLSGPAAAPAVSAAQDSQNDFFENKQIENLGASAVLPNFYGQDGSLNANNSANPIPQTVEVNASSSSTPAQVLASDTKNVENLGNGKYGINGYQYTYDEQDASYHLDDSPDFSGNTINEKIDSTVSEKQANAIQVSDYVSHQNDLGVTISEVNGQIVASASDGTQKVLTEQQLQTAAAAYQQGDTSPYTPLVYNQSLGYEGEGYDPAFPGVAENKFVLEKSDPIPLAGVHGVYVQDGIFGTVAQNGNFVPFVPMELSPAPAIASNANNLKMDDFYTNDAGNIDPTSGITATPAQTYAGVVNNSEKNDNPEFESPASSTANNISTKTFEIPDAPDISQSVVPLVVAAIPNGATPGGAYINNGVEVAPVAASINDSFQKEQNAYNKATLSNLIDNNKTALAESLNSDAAKSVVNTKLDFQEPKVFATVDMGNGKVLNTNDGLHYTDSKSGDQFQYKNQSSGLQILNKETGQYNLYMDPAWAVSANAAGAAAKAAQAVASVQTKATEKINDLKDTAKAKLGGLFGKSSESDTVQGKTDKEGNITLKDAEGTVLTKLDGSSNVYKDAAGNIYTKSGSDKYTFAGVYNTDIDGSTKNVASWSNVSGPGGSTLEKIGDSTFKDPKTGDVYSISESGKVLATGLKLNLDGSYSATGIIKTDNIDLSKSAFKQAVESAGSGAAKGGAEGVLGGPGGMATGAVVGGIKDGAISIFKSVTSDIAGNIIKWASTNPNMPGEAIVGRDSSGNPITLDKFEIQGVISGLDKAAQKTAVTGGIADAKGGS